MKDFSLAGLLIASGVLVTLSMLFSISESAFLSMNKLRLRVLCKKGNKRALRVSRLLERKEILINTLLIANELVNILLSSLITAAAMRIFGSKGVGIATFSVTLLLLVFGEITPKTISTRNPDGIAYSLSFFAATTVKILTPVVFVFTFISRMILKIRGITIEKPKQSYTEEDIKSFIDAGGETGVLGSGEKNMMNRVFKFTDLAAQDIMVPRTSVIAMNENLSYTEIVEFAKKAQFSRFPIYGKNLDDIIGVLYLRDLLKIQDVASFDLKKIMRPPVFIPGTNKISTVQESLRENHQSFAIVIDEYSGTDGILTKEDICHEIFGMSENANLWRNSIALSEFAGKDEFSLEGSTLLVDIRDLLNRDIKSDMSETLGGWITERLGRLALPKDCVLFDGYSFTVEEIFERRIKSVHIKKIEAAENE